jgi:hypothetical protein
MQGVAVCLLLPFAKAQNYPVRNININNIKVNPDFIRAIINFKSIN